MPQGDKKDNDEEEEEYGDDNDGVDNNNDNVGDVVDGGDDDDDDNDGVNDDDGKCTCIRNLKLKISLVRKKVEITHLTRMGHVLSSLIRGWLNKHNWGV